MGLYGRKCGNESMQIEACRQYAKGLENHLIETQMRHLWLANGRDVADVIDEEAVCATIMFAFFEATMATTVNAWADHMLAASKMVELLGPKRCATGVLHYIFRTVRIGIVSEPRVFHGSLLICHRRTGV